MVEFFKERVVAAFSSMKTADTISINDILELKKLQKYYIDPFNYVRNIMQDEDNFIIGRRGTGKSTLLYRAYIECINTWNADKKKYKNRILPIFIDLSQCESITRKFDSDLKFEEYFTYELIRNFRKHIYLFWQNIVPCDDEHIESSKLDEVNFYLDDIEELIKKGQPIKVSELEKTEKSGKEFEKNKRMSFGVSKESYLNYESNSKDNNYREVERKVEIKSNYTLGEFLDKLAAIKEDVDISSIYVFIDEYSELSYENQRILADLLKRLRGTRKGIFFKICAITDNYDLGEIRLQRDFYEISLDLYKFVERSNGLTDAFTRLEKFTENIIQERLNAFDCNIKIKDLFSNYSFSIKTLTRASIGIPRTIGIILKESWIQADAKGKAKISNDDLLFGIKSAGDGYYGFFNGNIGPVIPKLYDDMFEAILTRARQERKVNSYKGANMFLVSSFRDSHFKYLTENYLIHLLKKGTETSVKGETGLSLYMIDFSFIDKYNLDFTLDRDTYRQQRFVYNDIIKNFDVYFTNTRKAFKCPLCGTEYTNEQLFMPQFNTYLDICYKDKTKLEKVEGKEYWGQFFTETERKIIGTIRNKTRNDAILAREVAEIVGCTVQKVAKFFDKITDSTLIKRERFNGSAEPYRYYRGQEES